MQKLGFSGMKSLENFRSSSGSGSGTVRGGFNQNLKPSFDSNSYGSFANLKLTAEKLVKEQASVKTDLEMAHTKLRRATEQIHTLEAKLQQAVNENAKLKVKQTEDSKLWLGLDSKVSSTKTMCDQLTETLQQLASETRKAEKDKQTFEQKLEQNSKTFDNLNTLLNDLSTKLDCAETRINYGKQEITELKHQKEEMEKGFKDKLESANTVIQGKDSIVKQLEETIEKNKARMETLDSQLQKSENELKLRENTCSALKSALETLEREKFDLESKNQDLALKLDQSCNKYKELQKSLRTLKEKVIQLDKENLSIETLISNLLNSFEKYYHLTIQEKNLAAESAEGKIGKIQKEYSASRKENTELRTEIEGLKCKITEMEKAQEFAMVQHAEECRVAEEKIRKLASEAESIGLKKSEIEKFSTELQERVNQLMDFSNASENIKGELLQKISTLQSEKQDLSSKLETVLEENAKESENLNSEITKREQQVGELEAQVNQLQTSLNEKEQLHLSSLEKEQQLEEQKSQIQATLTTTECQLCEAKRQYDAMLEGKQLELSKHLKELSQRNDQAINDIRRKYEAEKVEIVNAEKEKAEKLIKEMERKCEEKITANREDAQKSLTRVKEEHGSMISKIQQEFEDKELSMRSHHKEELHRLELHAETELRERLSSLRKEHEIQMKSLKMQHEDDCRKLQEELELQKSKEEKQRALLQLQWKVMGENQQVDQEVNSKKEYSVSSMRRREAYSRKDHLQHKITSPEPKRKDASLSGMLQTPIANMLKKVDKGRKVTHHEFEVETGNGGRVTKRRKTRSTVMFGEPNGTQKSTLSKTPNATKIRKAQQVASGPHPRPANFGDLFSEGSLNPYADDPYAFD